jgi:hypothetical protein
MNASYGGVKGNDDAQKSNGNGYQTAPSDPLS